MLEIGDIKIYLCTGNTDMRKGVNGLSALAATVLKENFCKSCMFIFRGKRAGKIKSLWWDGQGFCLFYKCLDSGKFIWPKSDEQATLMITRGQFSMLIESIDWRNPTWSNAPTHAE